MEAACQGKPFKQCEIYYDLNWSETWISHIGLGSAGLDIDMWIQRKDTLLTRKGSFGTLNWCK
jgi:hypothetical protein